MMKRKTVRTIAIALFAVSAMIALPKPAQASEEGRRNTALAIGAAALLYIATQNNHRNDRYNDRYCDDDRYRPVYRTSRPVIVRETYRYDDRRYDNRRYDRDCDDRGRNYRSDRWDDRRYDRGDRWRR